jgi:hypothetical protein
VRLKIKKPLQINTFAFLLHLLPLHTAVSSGSLCDGTAPYLPVRQGLPFSHLLCMVDIPMLTVTEGILVLMKI